MNEAKKILEKTDGGLQVFHHYFGKINLSKTFCNPYRQDTRPSCRLYKIDSKSNGLLYYMKDYGDSRYCGNCFKIVSEIINLDIQNNFKHVLEQIDNDMCLNVFEESSRSFKPQKVTVHKLQECDVKTTSSPIISFTPQIKEFSPSELAYWEKYGIRKEILDKYEVKSIRKCNFQKENGKCFSIVSSNNLPIYAYFFENGKGIKFYRPKSEYRFMYAGKLPKPYIFGYKQLPGNGEYVFITGGEKDVLSLASKGFNAIALNSETAKIPAELIDDLSKKYRKIIILYDCDETGIQESTYRVKEFAKNYNITRIQLPLAGTKKEKDISDYFAMGNDKKEFVKLLKSNI